jgi:hypothetical protein
MDYPQVSAGASLATLFGASQDNPGLSGGLPSLQNNGEGNRITASLSGDSANGLNRLATNGSVNVEAKHDASINAKVVAVSTAVAVAGSNNMVSIGTLSLSGGGSETTNLVASTTKATVVGNISNANATLQAGNSQSAALIPLVLMPHLSVLR